MGLAVGDASVVSQIRLRATLADRRLYINLDVNSRHSIVTWEQWHDRYQPSIDARGDRPIV
jgi:hypothetical protein